MSSGSAVIFISAKKTWINQLGTPRFFIRAQTPLNIRGLTIQCVVSPGTSLEHHGASPDTHRSKGHVYFPLWERFGGKTRWLHLKFGEQAAVLAEAQVLRHFPDWPPPPFDPWGWWRQAASLSAALNQGCLCIVPCQSHIKGLRRVTRSTLKGLRSRSSGRLRVPEAAAGYLGDRVLSWGEHIIRLFLSFYCKLLVYYAPKRKDKGRERETDRQTDRQGRSDHSKQQRILTRSEHWALSPLLGSRALGPERDDSPRTRRLRAQEGKSRPQGALPGALATHPDSHSS